MSSADFKHVVLEIDAIERCTGDPEAAHGREDELHQWVLQRIGAGCEHPMKLAEMALMTKEIEFPRWMA